MGKIRIRTITKAIESHLEGVSVFKQAQSEETLTESIPETPLVQVIFEDFVMPNTTTSKISFKSINVPVVRPYMFKFNIDVYAQQRAIIGEDIAKISEVADKVIDVLEKQDEKPYFGLDELEAFSYTAERVTFEYARSKYAGIRFVLLITVY